MSRIQRFPPWGEKTLWSDFSHPNVSFSRPPRQSARPFEITRRSHPPSKSRPTSASRENNWQGNPPIGASEPEKARETPGVRHARSRAKTAKAWRRSFLSGPRRGQAGTTQRTFLSPSAAWGRGRGRKKPRMRNWVGGATFRGGRANWGGRQTNGRGFGARESLERKEEVRRPERFWVSDDEGGCIFWGRGGVWPTPTGRFAPFLQVLPLPQPGAPGSLLEPRLEFPVWGCLCLAAAAATPKAFALEVGFNYYDCCYYSGWGSSSAVL